MKNLEEIKRNWKVATKHLNSDSLDESAWESLLEQRIKKQKNISMRYFWASFTFQLIVYGFLAHVILKYSEDIQTLLPSVLCFLLYVPYTVVLMRKFKRLAALRKDDGLILNLSIKEYAFKYHGLLMGFYSFKTKYELVLVPLSSAIFVWVFFKIYFPPNGIFGHPLSSSLLFIFVLGACTIAILRENKRNFKKPIAQLEKILKDIQEK